MLMWVESVFKQTYMFSFLLKTMFDELKIKIALHVMRCPNMKKEEMEAFPYN